MHFAGFEANSQIPGDFSETMYPEIFGIPESFLVLLSQVIRLANEKEVFDQNSTEKTLTLNEFFSRATVLETCINQWNRSDSWPDDEEHRILGHYHRALHHALGIYFYRRIYNVSAVILQTEVNHVLNALLQYEEEDSRPTRYTSGIVWPGFIAACEALDLETQNAFALWFDGCARRSGLKTFELSKGAAEQIWNRKRETKDNSISLYELMKSQDIRLFYS